MENITNTIVAFFDGFEWSELISGLALGIALTSALWQGMVGKWMRAYFELKRDYDVLFWKSKRQERAGDEPTRAGLWVRYSGQTVQTDEGRVKREP